MNVQKKRRNSNFLIQNLFQNLIKKYDDAIFFKIKFLSRLNLIRTNRELKHKFNDFFTTNRAKILFNILNVFSNFFYVLLNVSNRSTNESTISIFFFRLQILFFDFFSNISILSIEKQTISTFFRYSQFFFNFRVFCDFSCFCVFRDFSCFRAFCEFLCFCVFREF